MPTSKLSEKYLISVNIWFTGNDLNQLRIPGVLQRFSLTYLIVAVTELVFAGGYIKQIATQVTCPNITHFDVSYPNNWNHCCLLRNSRHFILCSYILPQFKILILMCSWSSCNSIYVLLFGVVRPCSSLHNERIRHFKVMLVLWTMLWSSVISPVVSVTPLSSNEHCTTLLYTSSNVLSPCFSFLLYHYRSSWVTLIAVSWNK